MTSSNGTFSALLALCGGNSPVTSEFPSQRPVTRSFDVFFDLNRNKRLNKPSTRRWFATQSHSLWRHCNVYVNIYQELFKTSQFLPSSKIPLQWRHNERDGVSNHRRLDCLLNRLFRRWSKKTSKLRHWPLWRRSTGDHWISLAKSVTREMPPFDDVIMLTEVTFLVFV